MLIAILLSVAAVVTVFILISVKVFQVDAVPHKRTPIELGISYKEVKIPAENDLSLYAWWIPNTLKKNVPTIILVHGWKRNLERMMPYIENLHESFNLLAFDARSHGSSDKDNYSSMPRFAEDIKSVVDYLYLQNKQPVKIGVIGLSIGGAAAIYEASGDDRVNRIVTVGAFADPKEVMKLQMKNQHIPYWLVGWLLIKFVELRIGKKFKDIAPEHNIGKSKAKILLIHGKEDVIAPYNHAVRLFEASNKEKVSMLSLAGKGHSDCHKHPGFWKQLETFFQS